MWFPKKRICGFLSPDSRDTGIGLFTFNASLSKKTVTYNKKGFKNAGTYKVTVTGKGKYAGFKQTLTYKIKAKSQKVTIKKDTFSTTKKSVKKKAKSVGTIKAAVKTKGAKVTYTTNNSKIKVSKSGKITVAKGTKKGIYQVKVTVKALILNNQYLFILPRF